MVRVRLKLVVELVQVAGAINEPVAPFLDPKTRVRHGVAEAPYLYFLFYISSLSEK